VLIVIEGSIGSGKTTVARGLSTYRKSEGLFESFESNPFLAAFYEDPVKYSPETEFTFLFLHSHLLKVRTAQIRNSEVIADFHIAKDLFYANLNLHDARMRHVFSELYEVLVEQAPIPTLMICLSASNTLLIERIRQRKRDFELKIDPSYYADINNAYEKFFNQYTGRKIRISMDEWDFLKGPGLYGKLSVMIDQQLNST
jgi:deoxyguanosine kinase